MLPKDHTSIRVVLPRDHKGNPSEIPYFYKGNNSEWPHSHKDNTSEIPYFYKGIPSEIPYFHKGNTFERPHSHKGNTSERPHFNKDNVADLSPPSNYPMTSIRKQTDTTNSIIYIASERYWRWDYYSFTGLLFLIQTPVRLVIILGLVERVSSIIKEWAC